MWLKFDKTFLQLEPNFSMRNLLVFFIFFIDPIVEAFVSNISGKQNVLFIIGDDLRPTIGAYGDRTCFMIKIFLILKINKILYNCQNFQTIKKCENPKYRQNREKWNNFYGRSFKFCCLRPFKNIFFISGWNIIIRVLDRYRTRKKVRHRTVCPFRGHFAPRLFRLRFSFFDRNSSARIRMALKAPHSPVSV